MEAFTGGVNIYIGKISIKYRVRHLEMIHLTDVSYQWSLLLRTKTTAANGRYLFLLHFDKSQV